MTDPIGTPQERELIERLLAICPFLAAHHCSTDTITAAADALQSRIAEVERLTTALTDLVDWLEMNQRSIEGEFCMDELLSDARAALSLQRRV